MPRNLRTDPNLASRVSFHFTFEGQPILAYAGETVATALLAAGIRTLRHGPGDGGPRGLFCVMGLCQECVVSVEGRAEEACRLAATDGLDVRVAR
jgi:predicted molibdopterin-dependent oxidoreductase YjgC